VKWIWNRWIYYLNVVRAGFEPQTLRHVLPNLSKEIMISDVRVRVNAHTKTEMRANQNFDTHSGDFFFQNFRKFLKTLKTFPFTFKTFK